MISEEIIVDAIKKHLEGSSAFLVEVVFKNQDKVGVYIDKPEGVSLDDCASLNRHLSDIISLHDEDLGIEVSSPGLNEPFKVIQQYYKNIGKIVEIVLNSGMKIQGKLTAVHENSISIEENKIVKVKKKKMTEKQIHHLDFDEIKSTKEVIVF